jgi:alkanesulfonate monooxygenase SsuD/methylene tetrahydromethanopterin reductase-like flavin-dependent oxidoreductase (luciferase family)
MTNAQPPAGNNETLKFGIFDWIDRNQRLSLPETYEQRLRLLECADEAGLWCYHMAEHHGTPLGVAPSPNLFLAAAAQRTGNIRLSPMVQILPLNNPIRNIEEVCVLDNLSNGRLELGVGRGVSPEELAVYGLTAPEARDRFVECLDILIMGLSTGRVSYEGRYYSIKDAPILVRPLQRPYPPLWYPTSSLDSVAWVASQGFSTLLGFNRTPTDRITAAAAHYRANHAQQVGGATRLNAHVASPLVGATRHVLVADSDDEALALASTAYAEFDRSYLDRPGRAAPASTTPAIFDAAEAGVIAGSPDSVRSILQGFIDTTGVNYFAGTFAFGDLTTDQVLRSMRLFAADVMPALVPAANT